MSTEGINSSDNNRVVYRVWRPTLESNELMFKGLHAFFWLNGRDVACQHATGSSPQQPPYWYRGTPACSCRAVGRYHELDFGLTSFCHYTATRIMMSWFDRPVFAKENKADSVKFAEMMPGIALNWPPLLVVTDYSVI